MECDCKKFKYVKGDALAILKCVDCGIGFCDIRNQIDMIIKTEGEVNGKL